MTEHRSEAPKMDETLRRIVVGWRLLALVWMTGLVIEVLRDDPQANQAIVAFTLGLAGLWTGLTVLVARSRTRFVSWTWIVADGAVAVWVALAPLAADADSTFFGGYPLSWVIFIAYVSGQHWLAAGAISAGVMSVTQVLDEIFRQGKSSFVGDIAVFFATAWVMGWGMWALQHNEHLRIADRIQLGKERSRRIRADERAEIAARLHDSVLQTLNVMKQRVDDADEVRRLARRVERELRQFLDRLDSEYEESFTVAIREAAWDVEDLHDIVVDTVTVGDCELDDDLRALIAATREALMNAAKHAGVEDVSLFSEVLNGTASVYVRDRGAGFDIDDVDSGSRGIGTSITERVNRRGGSAVIHSTPGNGTEVKLTMHVDES